MYESKIGGAIKTYVLNNYDDLVDGRGDVTELKDRADGLMGAIDDLKMSVYSMMIEV